MDETTARVPFNRVTLTGRELEYVGQAVAALHLSGDGAFTARCHRMLEATIGARRVLLTTSCTDALEMVALLLSIAPGDEVIVPSFTFVSSANAFVLRGAVPVFADIRPDTLNLDEAGLEALITPRTRAIVVVHYAGIACEMDAIMTIAARHGVPVIEDNAHGLFGRYRGRPLGSFGAMATLSFHETKNVTSGEGGALVLNDAAYSTRAEIIREKGTDRSRFFRGETDKYSWVDVGSSFLPSEILAAFLCAQLEAADALQQQRMAHWNGYFSGLEHWAQQMGATRPAVPAHCEHPAHLFYLLLPSESERNRLLSYLRGCGISAVFHYLPLHLSPMGQRFGGRPGDCPVSESVSGRLLRLPLSSGLTASEQARVLRAVTDFR